VRGGLKRKPKAKDGGSGVGGWRVEGGGRETWEAWEAWEA